MASAISTVAAARGGPAFARLVEGKAVGLTAVDVVEGLMGHAERPGGRGGVARRGHAADGNGDADRTELGGDHFGGDGIEEALGQRTSICASEQALRDDAELVAGKPADAVAAAQLALQAGRHGGDDPVGDLVSVGVVDDGKVVHARDQEGAGDELLCAPFRSPH